VLSWNASPLQLKRVSDRVRSSRYSQPQGAICHLCEWSDPIAAEHGPGNPWIEVLSRVKTTGKFMNELGYSQSNVARAKPDGNRLQSFWKNEK
jgi:hypothetical protein